MISVIIPVYNVKDYVKKCIDSVINQTFKDLEIILVDDGSTDGSEVICDDYEKRDSRIKVIHKTNGGLSSARNMGIERSKGDYIGFIDSDDYIDKDMYEFLFNKIRQYEADIAVCGVYDCCGDKIMPQRIQKEETLLDKENALDYFLGGKGIGLFAVNKLYKREIFKDIRYPENKLYEDAFVFVDIILKCKKIIVSTSPKYYYVHRDESITISSFNSKYYDIVEAHCENLEKIKKYIPSKVLVGQFRVYWAYKQLLYILAFDNNRLQHKNDIEKVKKYIRKNFFNIIKNPYNSKAQIISYLLIVINPSLFMKVLRKVKQKGGFM